MNEQPHDQGAEQATLGAMLLSKQAIAAASEILKPEHFYRPNHGDIFSAILNLTTAGDAVDQVTLARQLDKDGVLKRIGGAPYLITLMQSVPSPLSAGAYATIVYDKWRQRKIIAAGQRFMQLGFTDAADSREVDQLLAEADATFRELGEPSRAGVMWDDLVTKWKEHQRSKGEEVIYSPWPEVNQWLPGGGFHPGQLVIVGGRPGNGKSNAGLNIVLRAAEHGYKAVVFSVEMDDVEVCSRLLAAGTWSKVSPIFAKKMDAEQKERVRDYISRRKGMPLEVVDKAYITVEKIIAHCRARRPKILFVDYAQLVSASNNKDIREQQVAHITRSLKVAAKELQMVVIVASQLKRKTDEYAEPVISDLRESGAAEQDADMVILLHRSKNARNMKMIIGKNRNGPTGEVPLQFRGELARVG